MDREKPNDMGDKIEKIVHKYLREHPNRGFYNQGKPISVTEGIKMDNLINDLTALFEQEKKEITYNISPETKDYIKGLRELSDHEKLRREHWSRAYCSYRGNDYERHNYGSVHTYARIALEEYDKKFNQ